MAEERRPFEPGPFESGPDELPDALPIFPLSGALLLPRGNLPLNIFEPRYLNMTLDALGAGRLIGMVQPRTPDEEAGHPPLFQLGCAGRIVSFSETEDGRLLISLKGVCRFRIARELELVRGYRRAAADFRPFLGDLSPDARSIMDRELFADALRRFLDRHGMQVDWEAIRKAPDEALVNSLAMLCPFRPEEKQALLEAPTLDDRYATIVTLLQMAVHDAPEGGGARQ